MKFRVYRFELTVENAAPETAVQRIWGVCDTGAENAAPQLLLTLTGPDILQYLSKGDELEVSVAKVAREAGGT